MELNPVKVLLLLLSLLALSFGLRAQKLSPADALYKEIAHEDSVLFDAFNAKKLDVIQQVLAKDLEFYHDKGGLTNYAENIEAFKATFAASPTLRRTLVPGSLEVYPIANYGAVQVAAHTFCHLENGKQDCGTFRFVHIWKKTAEGWKLARVVSYGH